MLKIGTIGIGGCGNKIVKLAAAEDFEALAINSAEVDCQDIEEVEVLLLGDSNGCGKDRKFGQALLKQKYTDASNRLEEFKDCDVVAIIASADGGTGGAMIPLLTHVLKERVPGPIYVPIIVLPFETEGVSSQKNAIDCLSEIIDLQVPYRIYDNSRCDESSLIKVYEEINRTIIEDLKVLRGDVCPASSYGNMDDRDRLKIASTKGLSITVKVNGIKENDLDKKSISDYIVESMKRSYNVDIERDKFVRRMGFIHSLPDQMISKIEKDYTGVKDYAGEPIEIFEHINVIEGDSGNVIAILSGLSDPSNRVSQMTEIIETKKKAITLERKSNISELKSSSDWLNSSDDDCIISNKRVEPSKDLNDIFSQY